MDEKIRDKIEMIRAQTRAAAFLIPLTAGCIGLFTLPGVRETLVGFIMGAATTAGMFYFKKSEDS